MTTRYPDTRVGRKRPELRAISIKADKLALITERAAQIRVTAKSLAEDIIERALDAAGAPRLTKAQRRGLVPASQLRGNRIPRRFCVLCKALRPLNVDRRWVSHNLTGTETRCPMSGAEPFAAAWPKARRA